MKQIFLSLLCLFSLCNIYSQENDRALIYKINIQTDINPTARIFLHKGLADAEKQHADAVLLHINTYGGAVADADSMRSAILYSKIPVHIFIDNNAASAGSLIAIACKKIYMRKGANIGAATVVNGQNGEAMPDKYQSYMRSMIRSTAESHGKKAVIEGTDTVYQWIRDPQIAEAMVDQSIYIPNIIDTGKVLTLTANEAVRLGFCDGIAESVDEVIKDLGYTNYRIEEFHPSFVDKLKGFLMNPAFQAILIMIIVAGIYFELQTPGVGFPALAAIVAGILYFTPLYIDGLAQNWELIVFIAGLILIAVEIFVLPGFGVSGVLGIFCISFGLIFAMLNNDYFSFDAVEMPDLTRSFFVVFSGVISSVILIIFISSRIGESGLFRKIALLEDLEDSESIIFDDSVVIGKTGTATTVLRPSGKVEIDNEIYDAVSNAGFIESGAEIRIVKLENMQIYVEAV
jgi:membrane-bound serine protease (ClpP class)